MLELIKFELKKIFTSKLVLVAFIGIAIFILINPIYDYKEINKGFNGKAEIQALANKYLSSDYTYEDLNNIRQSAREKYYNKEELTKEEELIIKYNAIFNKVNENNSYISELVANIDKEIKVLEDENQLDTYQYKSLLKERDMILQLPKEENLYLGGWTSIFDFNVAATMKVILVVVGLATIFTKEYSTKVAYINLSSKKGRSKLNTAKLIAAMIYATVAFIFVTIIFHICGLPFGVGSGNEAIVNVIHSVYDISIMEYYMLTLALSYIGIIAFAIITVLISLFCKNPLVSFGLPIVIFFLPEALMVPEAIDKYTRYLNFTKLLKGKDIFGDYLSFNIFNNVVLYPYMIVSVSLILILIMVLVYCKFSKKQRI